ncbi:MAG: hypothetical protein KJN60_03280 [Boseongicola sp.]|nr:hypothetical protein [Boseongicola sp.]
MSILKRLFGGGASSKPSHQPEVYKDFTITPEPMPADGQHRISAIITKDVNGELRSHHLIRADTLMDPGAAAEASIEKAKTLIDQQGDRLFN